MCVIGSSQTKTSQARRVDVSAALPLRTFRLSVLPRFLVEYNSLMRHIATDPTKLTKGRQFSKSAAPAREVDTSLWTETPAERQQRLADEVMGKRRRAVNAEPDEADDPETRKRRRHDEEVRRGVEEYTVCLSTFCPLL